MKTQLNCLYRCLGILVAYSVATFSNESACTLRAASTSQTSGGPPPLQETQNTDRWLVLPVTTELQRVKAGPSARAYVVVDGEWFRRDRLTLNAKALKLDALLTQLHPYANSPGASVYFYIRNLGTGQVVMGGSAHAIKDGMPGDPEETDYATQLLWFALFGAGQMIGFQHSAGGPFTYRGANAPNWETFVAPLKEELVADAGKAEDGLGTERFRVYPVRTALSRHIYLQSDCVLQVLVDNGLGPDDIKAMAEYVKKLALPRRHKIFILAPGGVIAAVSQPSFYKDAMGFAAFAQEQVNRSQDKVIKH